MEITVRKFDLLNELTLLQGVVERKTTMPILANVLAEAEPEGRLLLSATNLDLTLETSCAATVKKSGACAIPARKLYDYVNLLPDAELTVKRLENHWAQIRCGRNNTRIVGMSRESFPALPRFPASGGVKIPAEALRAAIAKTIFAISNEESRYTMNGALMVLKPSALTLVATDGHRMAHIVRDQLTLDGVTGEMKALVPKRAMSELTGLLGRAAEDATVEFAQDDNHLFFRLSAGGVQRVLAARKLTGQFPNYEAVLPKSQQHSIPLNREALSSAIRRVDQFADERTHAIRLRLEADRLILAASSGEMGESEEELDIKFEGEALVIGFNAKYLEEFLDAEGADEVLLEFKDEQSAGQLRPRASDGYQYRYVVMPMRI